MRIGIKQMKKVVIIVLGLSCALALGLSTPVLAKNAQTDKIPANSGKTSGAIKPGPSRLMHVSYRISGRVAAASSGHIIAGRKVKIRLRKGGHTIFSQTKTLDHNGACTYEFRPMMSGTYTVSIEKVPTTGVNPESTVNACFLGTTPEARRVTLSSETHTAKNQDFTINFNIAFDRHGICW